MSSIMSFRELRRYYVQRGMLPELREVLVKL